MIFVFMCFPVLYLSRPQKGKVHHYEIVVVEGYCRVGGQAYQKQSRVGAARKSSGIHNKAQ